MKKSIYLLFAFAFCFAVQSCTDKVNTELFHYTDEEYELLTERLDIPLQTYDYTILSNIGRINDNPDLPFHKATLGRVLFYDKMLSIDESTSCASCHKQSAAFADTEKFSEGLDGKIGTRNSLPLGNTIGFVRYYGTDLTFQSGFFSWDEKFESIDQQSEAAITAPNEMGHDMSELTKKIREQDYYQVLFDKAYGENNPITQANILDAVTEFVNSLSSRDSHFDKSIPTPINSFSPADVDSDFPGFSASENRGKTLFNASCGNCHGTSHNSIVQSSANNGLDMTYADKGLGDKENQSELYGVFKVPSLRNIELSGPYMHDGRFETLEEVVEHYSSGVQNHPNLHNELSVAGEAKKFNFSETDKADIINYMKSLTDDDFVAAVRWSDPFK